MNRRVEARGWRQQLDAGIPMLKLVVPVNMPLPLWMAVIEALEETSINTEEIADAYQRLLDMYGRVAQAAKHKSSQTV